MKPDRPITAVVLTAALSLASCAGMQDVQALAPQPAKPIDAAKFYSGRWYEIARTPMKLTNGCVSGTTDYFSKDGALIDRDACRAGTPEGKEKVFAGPVTILNPTENTKVSVSYRVFGVFSATKTYWMLDHGDDYDWFIVSDPQFKNVSIFTRAAQPANALISSLTSRVKQLGYDPQGLEFPTRFPSGEGQPAPNLKAP